MNFRPFGRTDLQVSELCLGTMHFGWKTDERTSLAILDAFRDAGGNFLQAATSIPDIHGLDLLATASAEKHVGRWIATRRVPRESLVLASRLILRDGERSDRSLAESLRATCERSLRRLRIDHLDLLLFEWNPHLVPLDRLSAALWPLVRDGLVRYVGASGFPAWRLMESMQASARGAFPRFEAVQHDFSLVARRMFETELADLCREKRLAFLARSPLAGGFLVDGPPRWPAWSAPGREVRLRTRYNNHRSLSVRDVLDAIALSRGASVARIALAWVLAQPTVTSAVIGVTSTEQLANVLGATTLELSARELALLKNPAALTPSALLGTDKPAPRAGERPGLDWAPPAAEATTPPAVAVAEN